MSLSCHTLFQLFAGLCKVKVRHFHHCVEENLNEGHFKAVSALPPLCTRKLGAVQSNPHSRSATVIWEQDRALIQPVCLDTELYTKSVLWDGVFGSHVLLEL